MTSTSTTAVHAELLCQHLAQAEFGKTGRRSFFEYRDTGLGDITNGKFRAQVMRATDVLETTGWHYHECELQFVYVLKGWVELAFEDGRTERVKAGGAMSIPGGMIHNEISSSEDFEALEIASPADMGTVAVPAPTT